MKDSDWDVDLPTDARQRREVFARFGLASYQAQCVEKQMAMLLSSACNKRFAAAFPEERERLWHSEATKTLGRMLKSLEERRIRLPAGIHGRLHRALLVRNRLAHNYFLEKDREILSCEGRERMIRELTEDADFLASVDAELTQVHELWAIQSGATTSEKLQEFVRNYIREGLDP